MNRPPIKPGWKSSEFWLTAVSFLFSGLYLVGLLDNNTQKEDLINETSRGVEAIILIIGQLTVLFKYIKGRSEIKKIWWSTANTNKRRKADKINDGDKIDDTERKPKKQTTRTNKSKPRKSK